MLFVDVLETDKLNKQFDVPLEDIDASNLKVNNKITVTYNGTIVKKAICVIERVFNIEKVW